MIVKEFFKTRMDNVNLYRTYSDAKYFINKVGTDEVYIDAIDVEGAPYEYVETNELIPEENDEPRRNRE
jgi:hypothetical protein